MKLKDPIAICAPARLPFGQIGKLLAKQPGYRLGANVANHILKTYNVNPEVLDGVVDGENFTMEPNPGRMIANIAGLRDETTAITIANNCATGLEVIADASRRILTGEGSIYLAVGQETLSSVPFIVKGARLNKKTGTINKLKGCLTDLPEGVELRDVLEDGLNDGVTSYAMPVVGEILAQNYAIEREVTDNLAHESFKRALDAFEAGKYAPYMVPVKNEAGEEITIDEAVTLRRGLAENPGRMAKAMLIFDNPYYKFDDFIKKYSKYIERSHTATVSIFSATPRSDGAAGLIVTTLSKAKELGLEVEALLTGWKMKGVDPNLMGLGQATASIALLEEHGLSPNDIDYIEIHEAFASTAVATLEEMKKQLNFDWQSRFADKKINPHGGSISIGHPFGATGIRLAINSIMDFKQDPKAKKVLTTACAHGGVAATLLFERP